MSRSRSEELIAVDFLKCGFEEGVENKIKDLKASLLLVVISEQSYLFVLSSPRCSKCFSLQ